MKNLIGILFLLLINFNLLAHDGEMEGADIGPDKGFIEAHEETGFKLSVEAEKHFEIKKIILSKGPLFFLPTSALASSLDDFFIYRYRAGFYKQIHVILDKPAKNNLIQITSNELRAGDQVVISGVAFLRVSNLAIFSAEDDEPAHHEKDQHEHE